MEPENAKMERRRSYCQICTLKEKAYLTDFEDSDHLFVKKNTKIIIPNQVPDSPLSSSQYAHFH
jgi:ribosomal protein S18